VLPRAGTLAAFVVLSALLVGTLWVVPYLPTNDGPEWVFATHVENHYADPGTPYRDKYVPALQFASRGFTLLYGPLESWFGWQRGLTVALSVTVLVVAWSFVVFVCAVDRRREALAFLGFPLALSWSLYMGFWAYALATAAGLLVLAYAVVLEERPRPLAYGLLSLLLFMVAVAHVFAAVLTGAALLILLVARAPQGGRLVAFGKGALVGLPAAGIGALSVLVARGAAATHLSFATGFGWMAWRDALLVFPQTVLPGPAPRAVVFVVGLLVAAGAFAARALRSETSAVDRGVGLAALLFLAAALVAPAQVPGWQGVSQRFITLGVALVIAVVPFERVSVAVQRRLSVAIFAVSAVSLVLSYPMHRRLVALCDDAVAGLGAPIHRSGEELPIVLADAEVPGHDWLHAEVPMMNPLLHMGALYASVHGGLIPYTFATSGATHPFTLRSHEVAEPVPNIDYYWGRIAAPAFQTSASFRRDVVDDLAGFGIFYEGVIVLGARPEDLELFRDRGYVADWQRGETFLGHFEPCSLDVTMSVASAQTGPVFDVILGKLAPLSDVRAPFAQGDDGLGHFVFPRTPCGALVVRVKGPVGARCSHADAHGEIHARITRESHVVACGELGEAGGE
jgi:hypothetical protein